jgi:hypothetical protein
MVTIASSAGGAGADATAAQVTLSGTGLSAAEVASIRVCYNGCSGGGSFSETINNPTLTDTFTLAGNQLGGGDWTFYVTFNTPASVTDFVYTVDSITGTDGAGLPHSTPTGADVDIGNTHNLGTITDNNGTTNITSTATPPLRR